MLPEATFLEGGGGKGREGTFFNCAVLPSISGRGVVACENQVKHHFHILREAIPDPLVSFK